MRLDLRQGRINSTPSPDEGPLWQKILHNTNMAFL